MLSLGGGRLRLDVTELDTLKAEWSLCIGGDALAIVANTRVVSQPVQELIARTSVL